MPDSKLHFSTCSFSVRILYANIPEYDPAETLEFFTICRANFDKHDQAAAKMQRPKRSKGNSFAPMWHTKKEAFFALNFC
jgi:hypothetical protein